MSSLDSIRIAKPCPAAWSEMEGDAKMRHCSKCRQRVYNLTEMTTAEAELLLANRDGRMCLRYFRRADGRIMTKDCPVGVKRTRTQRAIMVGGVLTFLLNLIPGARPEVRNRWNTGSMPVATPKTKEADQSKAVMGSPMPPTEGQL